MAYSFPERRINPDRRRGSPDRRAMLDFARLGTDSEKRESIVDRRGDDVRRSADLITINKLEMMR